MAEESRPKGHPLTAEAGVRPSATSLPEDRPETGAAAWLDLLVQWAALAVVALGIVGLPLLLVGWFKPYLVLPLAVVLWLILAALRGGAVGDRRGRAAHTASPARTSFVGHAISVAAVVVAAVGVVVNGAQSAQHLLVDGDPAVYGMTGKWIAEHGSLNIPIHPEWLGNDRTINYMTNGFFLRSDGHHLYPQFFHLLPALLAVGDWFAGTGGLLHLNMLLGGFAVLAVFVFASKLMHPIWALAAAVALSMTLPQLFFTRDTFSEIPSQFLVFAGLALLCDCVRPRCKRPGVYGLLAGLTLGASTMARIDAFLYIPAVLAAVVVLALMVSRSDPERRARVRIVVGVAIGFALTGVIAVADAVFGSPVYAKSVANELIAIAALTVVVIAAGTLLLTRAPVEDFAKRAAPWLPRIAPATGAVVIVGLAAAWLVRPLVQHVHETGVLDVSSTIANLQRSEHVAVDPTRHYNEMSLTWISWYVGPCVLALAIVGFGYLAYRVLRGRDAHAVPFLLLAGIVTAGYAYDPLIVPVQYWATRRFVPVTFPAVWILAFFVLSRLFAARRANADARGRSAMFRTPLRRVAAPIAVVLAVVSLATPVVLMRGPVRLVRDYVPVRDVASRLCLALKPSDVVLLVGYDAQTNGFVQTIETYCGHMAAVSGIATERPQIVAMAQAAAASRHRLVLVSSQQQPTDGSGIELGITLHTVVTSVVFDTEALSLTHRPDSDFKVQLPVYLSAAPLS